MSQLTIDKMTFDVMFSEESIHERIAEMGKEISAKYKGLNPILMIVLNGGFIFGSDLMRSLDIDCEVDFIKISSYGDAMSSSGEIKMKKDYDALVKDRHVIVVEDIVDSGLSLTFLKRKFELQDPASVAFATLLHKPSNSSLDFDLDYVGFDIGPEFVLGYGLDYKQKWRNLRSVYVRVDNK
jgi:hypoxanthine phosphoribosyltransferase